MFWAFARVHFDLRVVCNYSIHSPCGKINREKMQAVFILMCYSFRPGCGDCVASRMVGTESRNFAIAYQTKVSAHC
jgi:hypothetical protein